MYEGVENETRRLLATLPQADLEAVVRFFEAMHAVRTERRAGATLTQERRAVLATRGLGDRGIQARCDRREGWRGSVPSQLVHVVEEWDICA